LTQDVSLLNLKPPSRGIPIHDHDPDQVTVTILVTISLFLWGQIIKTHWRRRNEKQKKTIVQNGPKEFKVAKKKLRLTNEQ